MASIRVIAYSIVCLVLCGPFQLHAVSTRKLLTFGLVADTHFDTFPVGEKAPWQSVSDWHRTQAKRSTTITGRRYDISKDKMEESVNFFNSVDDMDFVVNLGDIVNNDMMWNLKPILDAFNNVKAPHYNLLGNHDRRAHNDRDGKLNQTQNDWVMNKLGLKAWYYTLSFPPFRLIFIDSMVLELKRTKEFKTHWDWVSEQIDAAKERNEIVIVFAHVVIGMKTSPIGPILTRHTPNHIVAGFFGHNHKGEYTRQSGIHCVTIQGQIEMLTNAYAIVEVYEDRMELTGFGRVPSRIMPFESHVIERLKAWKPDGQKADLASQGHQPLPPDKLWANEVLQEHPPLGLVLKDYKKPSIQPAEMNQAGTIFFKKRMQQKGERLVHADAEEHRAAETIVTPKPPPPLKRRQVPPGDDEEGALAEHLRGHVLPSGQPGHVSGGGVSGGLYYTFVLPVYGALAFTIGSVFIRRLKVR